ncbi:hypothetical protein [Pseudoroseicyclus sp. CXY001]|uniref:hypothetical protein n=1 Tax=Pseudoroseicyclus sp. CXY001 TaxID=3242492 RepID=UPI003570E5F5
MVFVFHRSPPDRDFAEKEHGPGLYLAQEEHCPLPEMKGRNNLRPVKRQLSLLAVLVVSAAIAGLIGLYDILATARIMHGTVVTGEVVQKEEVFPEGPLDLPGTRLPEEWRLDYAFETGGAEYRGGHAVSEALWRQLDAGDPVQVHFMRAHPEESLVEDAARRSEARIPFMLALAFAAAAGGLALHGAYSRLGRDFGNL